MGQRGFGNLHPTRFDTQIVNSRRPKLTEEESQWVTERILRNHTDVQVTRMFFRAFNRDLSGSTVYARRLKLRTET